MQTVVRDLYLWAILSALFFFGKALGRGCLKERRRGVGHAFAYGLLGLPLLFLVFFGGIGSLVACDWETIALGGTPLVLGYLRGLLRGEAFQETDSSGSD